MSALPRLSLPGNSHWPDYLARVLRERGYVVMPAALPDRLAEALFLHVVSLPDAEFRPGGIGKRAGYRLNGFVRNDAIAWLDRTIPASGEYLDWMERLRLELNRRLFLGLFDFECHYARYAPGSFYKKHMDAFRDRPCRRVSTVLYLNPGWMPEDGGELVLYSPRDHDREIERIAPQHGKLVLFLSEDFPHEVLTARRTRYSIAGWFRVNESRNGMVVPPA